MSRNASSKATLKARISKQLARLARLVPVDNWNDEAPDLQLPSWPGWIDQLVAALVLLRPLDPLAALRGLGALNRIVGSLDGDFEDINEILDRQRDILPLFASFRAELGNSDPRGVADLVVTLVTEDDLLDEGDEVPRPLLDALGQEGRVAVTLRLADLRRSGFCPTVDLAWWMTEILLAEPKLEDALELITRLGLEEQLSAMSVVRRFLKGRVVGPGFLDWVRRLFREPVGDMEDTLPVLMECVELCDAMGQPELAQTIRREALPVVLDVEMLR